MGGWGKTRRKDGDFDGSYVAKSGKAYQGRIVWSSNAWSRSWVVQTGGSVAVHHSAQADASAPVWLVNARVAAFLAVVGHAHVCQGLQSLLRQGSTKQATGESHLLSSTQRWSQPPWQYCTGNTGRGSKWLQPRRVLWCGLGGGGAQSQAATQALHIVGKWECS